MTRRYRATRLTAHLRPRDAALWLVRRALALGAGIATFVALAGGPAAAADPDFSAVTDILGGQRHLLRDDDLIVSGAFGGSSTPSVLTLRTANSQVSPPIRNDFSLTSGQARSAAGRMYALANDVVATLVVGQPGNPATLGVRIVDPVKGTSAFSPIPGS